MKKKVFRIVQQNRQRVWNSFRVDQRHTLLFGLIKYWDHGAADLSPDYNFKTFTRAQNAIIKKFPSETMEVTIFDGKNNAIVYHKGRGKYGGLIVTPQDRFFLQTIKKSSKQ